MDRLKQEWKETRIPDEVCLRARNAAWAKIQHPVPFRPKLVWATTGSVFIVAIAFVWIWSMRETRIDRVAIAHQPGISTPKESSAQTAVLQAETPAKLQTDPVRKPAVQMRASRPSRRVKTQIAQVREPERVILNFTLPETGASMIWIMDSSFHFDGGVE
jgi:hypothetical protein